MRVSTLALLCLLLFAGLSITRASSDLPSAESDKKEFTIEFTEISDLDHPFLKQTKPTVEELEKEATQEEDAAEAQIEKEDENEASLNEIEKEATLQEHSAEAELEKEEQKKENEASLNEIEKEVTLQEHSAESEIENKENVEKELETKNDPENELQTLEELEKEATESEEEAEATLEKSKEILVLPTPEELEKTAQEAEEEAESTVDNEEEEPKEEENSTEKENSTQEDKPKEDENSTEEKEPTEEESETPDEGSKQAADIGDINSFKLTKPSDLTAQLVTVESCVTHYSNLLGASLTEEQTLDFYKWAKSDFTKSNIEQKYLYKSLEGKLLKTKIPEYVQEVISTDESQAELKTLASQLKKCKNGFVYQVINTEHKDKVEGDQFIFNTQLVAGECRDQEDIRVILFEGSRKGTFLTEDPKEREEVKNYAKKSLLWIAKKHFGDYSD